MRLFDEASCLRRSRTESFQIHFVFLPFVCGLRGGCFKAGVWSLLCPRPSPASHAQWQKIAVYALQGASGELPGHSGFCFFFWSLQARSAESYHLYNIAGARWLDFIVLPHHRACFDVGCLACFLIMAPPGAARPIVVALWQCSSPPVTFLHRVEHAIP